MTGFRRLLVLLLLPLLVAAHTWPVLVALLEPEGEHHCACPLDDHDCKCPICTGDLKVNDRDWERTSLTAEPCGVLPSKPGLLARVPVLATPVENALEPPRVVHRGAPPPTDPPVPDDPRREPPVPPPRVA